MKFSIRDLFLMTVIVALILGWLMDHRTLLQWENALEREKDRKTWESRTLAKEWRSAGAQVDISEEWITIDQRDSAGYVTKTKIRYKP
ncbi:MAG: hypothetical protein ACKVP0_03755 [Pirellulaceae bacterium]